VFYTPGHECYGFDIYVFTKDGGYFLSVDETNALFEAEGFFYARSLFTGSLDDCLKHPNQFQSKIAEWLGLPAIKDNVCEGIVIRPVTPCYLRTGSRALIKSKNEKFAEKKSVKRRNKQLEQLVEYSKELTELLGLLDPFINENRLANVVSHIGEVQIPRDLGKLIKEMSYDVVEDFLKEHSALYNVIDKSEIKVFNKELNKKITSVIKRVYMTAH
jgi:Rnl2 family RNA ligase